MTWTRWTRRATDQVTPIGGVLKLRLSQVLVIEHDDEPDETVVPHEILLSIPADAGGLVVDVAPTPDGWGYKVFEEYDEAANNASYWITVPEPQTGAGDTEDTAIDDNDLPHVQGSDLAPAAPTTPAWVAALTAAVASLQAAINAVADGDVDSIAGLQGIVTAAALKTALALPANTVTELADKATHAELTAAIAAVLNGAPGALDTLKELADALGDDANFAANLTNTLAAMTAALAAEVTNRLNVEKTLVRFRDTDGNPIVGKVVTITVDTDLDEIDNIIVEAAP